jgi:hypothetical protein
MGDQLHATTTSSTGRSRGTSRCSRRRSRALRSCWRCGGRVARGTGRHAHGRSCRVARRRRRAVRRVRADRDGRRGVAVRSAGRDRYGVGLVDG